MTHVKGISHEQFVHEIAALGIGRLTDPETRAKAGQCKLTYGAGMPGLRGITYYQRWLDDKGAQKAFVEICAQGEENPVQLAGTTLHELGHVIAGFGCGHDKGWKLACERLGLRRIKAAGTLYTPAMFTPDIRASVAALAERLNDGKPVAHPGVPMARPKPCSAGMGVRGGKSRGVGSGSRLRKYVCSECGQILRASTDTLQASHDPDNGKFELEEKS